MARGLYTGIRPAKSDAPSVRFVARHVKAINSVFDGPGPVSLVFDRCWSVLGWEPWREEPQYGKEEIPGDDRPVDATAIARRLLAAFRDS